MHRVEAAPLNPLIREHVRAIILCPLWRGKLQHLVRGDLHFRISVSSTMEDVYIHNTNVWTPSGTPTTAEEEMSPKNTAQHFRVQSRNVRLLVVVVCPLALFESTRVFGGVVRWLTACGELWWVKVLASDFSNNEKGMKPMMRNNLFINKKKKKWGGGDGTTCSEYKTAKLSNSTVSSRLCPCCWC